MSHRSALACFTLAAALAPLAISQVTIKKVPPTPTSPASGQEMFQTYCAVCHGKDGKGGGPAVPALKMAPPDLTSLGRLNQGKFPELRVFNAIKGDLEMAAHGSRDMPIWGDVLRSLSRGHESDVQMRMTNLTKYIQSLQVK